MHVQKIFNFFARYSRKQSNTCKTRENPFPFGLNRNEYVCNVLSLFILFFDASHFSNIFRKQSILLTSMIRKYFISCMAQPKCKFPSIVNLNYSKSLFVHTVYLLIIRHTTIAVILSISILSLRLHFICYTVLSLSFEIIIDKVVFKFLSHKNNV